MIFFIVIVVLLLGAYFVWNKYNPANQKHAVYDVSDYSSSKNGSTINNSGETGTAGSDSKSADGAADTSNRVTRGFNSISAISERNGYVVRDAEPKQASPEQLRANREAENSSEYWAEVARREAAAAARADSHRGTVGIPATETGSLISYAQKEFNFEGVQNDLFAVNQLHPFGESEEEMEYQPEAPAGEWADGDKETSELKASSEQEVEKTPKNVAQVAKEKIETIKEKVFKKNDNNFNIEVTVEGVIKRNPFVLKNPISILAVSDEAEDIEQLKKLATDAGASIEFIENGIKCLEVVKGKVFDVILIPRYMPRMDGVQTIKNLNNMPMNRCYNAKVYAVISENFDEDENQLLKKGFTGILRRPFGRYTFQNMLIENSEEKNLPDDKDMINEIKAMAVQEDKLLKGGISFSAALDKFGGNLKNYRRAVCKFCKDYDKDSSELLKQLNIEDENGYMKYAREFRDKAAGLGAGYLADMFDDHVNIAKEDSLEIAAVNWRPLAQKWRDVCDCFEKWLGLYETGVLYEYPTNTNGIQLSKIDLKAMLYKATECMDAGNISSEARDILESAVDYDMPEEYRNMLYDILHNINMKKYQNVKTIMKKLIQTIS
ncbi:CheY chemotaxis protein or a CheY-like REC (receiver) domain [Eubacterium ruminantium]|nr:CheY chemotaxis protein or a CheY-like REC (receiver) domain [Eubacterium ruminantium]